MPTNLVWLDADSNPITADNLGAIDVNSSLEQKVFLANEGSSSATGVVVQRRPVSGNDGVNYASIAEDDGTGNPGTYSTSDLFIGTINGGEQVPLWIKITLPNSVTPAGNVRMLDLFLIYTGT